MKLFTRAAPPKRSGASVRKTKRRLGLKLTFSALVLAGGFGLVAFYGLWAQTFDLKKVGEMPERNTVFDVDGKIYSRLAGANRLKVPLERSLAAFH